MKLEEFGVEVGYEVGQPSGTKMYLYNGYYSTAAAAHFEDSFVLGYDSRQTQQKHLPDDTID